VFDAPTVSGGILSRLEGASGALKSTAKYVKVHPHSICNGIEHLLESLAVMEGLGGEGLMLRRATATHVPGRTTDLLKVKSFHDDEALVTGYEEGKGKYSKAVGSLVCVSKAGACFKVGSGLTDQQRIYGNAPKIGDVIEYRYLN